MRWSRSFIPTLRDNPADAECQAEQLLIRAGFVRRVAPGAYALLPLGQRTMLKIAGIVRQELNAAGAQEFHLPATAGDVFEFARKEIRSYKDLPQAWYAIRGGLTDANTRTGLLRLRQFTMSTSCFMDVEREEHERSSALHHGALTRIFARCGLSSAILEARSAHGATRRFMVGTVAGEGNVVACACGYAAMPECASSRLPAVLDSAHEAEVREVHTPGRKTIAEVSQFLGSPPSQQIKSLVYIADERPVVFLVRGDHQLNEAKAAAQAGEVRPALAEEMRAVFGAEAGSLGPLRLHGVPVLADLELRGRRNMICGANRDDYHLTGVAPGVHFEAAWADLRAVEPGEACVLCGGALDIRRATEVGSISESSGGDAAGTRGQVLAADGRQVPLLAGSCGIVLEGLMAAAVEIHHDADGIVWPAAISPFHVIVTPVTQKGEVKDAGERIYGELVAAGYETLLDDRPERPGVKFKDADLIGIPFRVVLGGENLKQGKVELFERAGKATRLVPIEDLATGVELRQRTDTI